MPEYVVMYVEPGTGVVMFRDRVTAPTREAAMREAQAWQAKRPSLRDWGVTVEEPQPRKGASDGVA